MVKHTQTIAILHLYLDGVKIDAYITNLYIFPQQKAYLKFLKMFRPTQCTISK